MKRMMHVLALLSVSLLSILHTLTPQANPLKPGMVEVELVSEMSQIKSSGTQRLAFIQRIEPGWHTYWINPGDSGAPTELTFSLPDGATVSEIRWPAPEAIAYGPLMNFGYHGEVIMLVDFTMPRDYPSETIELRVNAEWLVCADICIPEDAELKLVLPVSNEEAVPDPEIAAMITKAESLIPRPMDIQAYYRVSGESIDLVVSLPGLKADRISEVRYFPFQSDLIDNPAEQVFSVGANGLAISIPRAAAYDAESEAVDFAGVLVVKEDSGEKLQVPFIVNPRYVRGAGLYGLEEESSGEVSLLMAFFYAVLGGLILNLMPCVFPVLSIKVLSLVQHQEQGSEKIRIHGLAYLAGVVLSFLLIAVVLMVLRWSGAAIGWGFQLQSPMIVTLLAYLFFVIGLNLSGVFEWGTRLMGLGDSPALSSQKNYGSSFVTGVLAVVIASPCTAPFMGAAIGYALLQPGVASLVIFLGLGLGMGIPYVLLCFFPAALAWLPKPGQWMATLKEFLAFPMYASAVWLLWVMSLQSGPDGVLSALAGLVLIALGIWLINQPGASGLKRYTVKTGGLVAILVALYLAWSLIPAGESMAASVSSSDKVQRSHSGPAWEDYRADRLKELIATGPVFVNFTAAWCITCKVNEALSLDTRATKDAFEKWGIAYLRGDWTNEDPNITAILAEYGRSGVPLYLLFRQGEEKAVVLPQMMTQEGLLEAIDNGLSEPTR